MVIPTLKTCYFEASEDMMTKFKSQALQIKKPNIEKLVGVATLPLSSNSIYTACLACKNPVRNRLKIKLDKLDFSN